MVLFNWQFFAAVCIADGGSNAADNHILPETELFPPILADQREYVFSIQYEYRDQEDHDFKAAEVSFGDSLPIKNFELSPDSTLQLTFDGVIYSLYDLDTESYDLVNSDYLVGFSSAYRRGDFSTRLRIRHQSSHVGDEYLLHNSDTVRENTSFEEAQIMPAFEWQGWRVYAGGGAIFHSKNHIEPWNLQGGLEYLVPTSYSEVSLFLAADYQGEARTDWTLNQSYRTGVLFGQRDERNIRLALEFVDGYAQDGQFAGNDSRYFGLAVFFQL